MTIVPQQTLDPAQAEFLRRQQMAELANRGIAIGGRPGNDIKFGAPLTQPMPDPVPPAIKELFGQPKMPFGGILSPPAISPDALEILLEALRGARGNDLSGISNRVRSLSGAGE